MELNIYNDTSNICKNQSIYDSYNNLMFSSERNIIFKLLMRHRLYEMIKDIHGDIVECGVFKGAGIALWLKMMEMDHPHDIRKVIGFDYFGNDFVEKLSDPIDSMAMKQVFDRCSNLSQDDISIEGITAKLLNAGFPSDKFELVKGNISVTSSDFLKNRPGFRISILYMDLDIDEPTYDTLCNLWSRVVPGGLVVFDEYAYHSWTEANAVDRFVEEKGLTLHKLNIKSPNAYIVKDYSY